MLGLTSNPITDAVIVFAVVATVICYAIFFFISICDNYAKRGDYFSFGSLSIFAIGVTVMGVVLGAISRQAYGKAVAIGLIAIVAGVLLLCLLGIGSGIRLDVSVQKVQK